MKANTLVWVPSHKRWGLTRKPLSKDLSLDPWWLDPWWQVQLLTQDGTLGAYTDISEKHLVPATPPPYVPPQKRWKVSTVDPSGTEEQAFLFGIKGFADTKVLTLINEGLTVRMEEIG